jgi:hypothetical protein
MSDFSRRAFLGASIGSLCILRQPGAALAAAECGDALSPYSAGVNCSASQNYRLFQAYPKDLGLLGVVAIAPAKAQAANLRAGTMILFPYLRDEKPGPKPRASLQAYLPTGGKRAVLDPKGLPPDELFVRTVLMAPWTSFIGFTVQPPFDNAAWIDGDSNTPSEPARFASDQALRPWRTNVDRLGPAKTASVGIEWTSSNLNNAWFAGSQFIPADDNCAGNAWRRVIIDGLRQASVGAGC